LEVLPTSRQPILSERDDQFRDRIASLVSAIGQLLPPKA